MGGASSSTPPPRCETSAARRSTRAATPRRWRGSGQRPTITRRQRWAGIDRRERELGAGHAEVHHAAYVATTVRGNDTRELERAWQVTEQNASAARMRLEVLTRRQAQALTLTLPLGRGLR